jgi:hypothetical protein
MRRIAVALATVILAAGCSSAATSPPKAPASSSPTVDKQAQFLTAVHSASISSWVTSAPTDPELLAYPAKWCAALDDGHSVAYILNLGSGTYPAGMSWGTRKIDAEHVLVLAVTAYCPAHRTAVVQELQADGSW